MTLGSRLAAVLAHSLMVVGFGCATMAPPARSSGASLSDEGISLAVVGQTCADHRAPGGSPSPSLDATFAIEVGNPTPQPVSVHPERIILRAPGPVSPQSFKRDDDQSDLVEGGTTQPFKVRFVASGVTCSQEMQLDSGSALEWRGRPVRLPAVRFVPVAPVTGPVGSR
jgi:hypothetical protein